MNTIQIMGHLGADPEVRFTPSGQKVINLRLATNSKSSGKEETTWWNVTIWPERCQIEKMLPYLKKGSALIIMGELRVRPYADKEGNQRFSLDVTADTVRFSPFGKPDSTRQEGSQTSSASPYSGNQPFAAQAQNSYQSTPSYGQNQAESMSNLADDDSIPF
ncbi:MAG TPA: single-stranded DNA-binding protein [Parachlamydiaceae bacterium]|nr:single-stranded DNA-binding protein [Parachlamydiaceae bacterium]